MDEPTEEQSRQQEQRIIVLRLQLLWLTRMETLFTEEKITSTDMATLYRFLADNGWSLDPSKLPQKLAEKLTDRVAFDEEDEMGLRVVR